MDNLDNTYVIQLDTTKEHYAPFKFMSIYGKKFKSLNDIDKFCKKEKIGEIIYLGYIKELKTRNFKRNGELIVFVYIGD